MWALNELRCNRATSELMNVIEMVADMLRERCWQLCGLQYARIRINIDTTVKTVFGNQQGARKGHILSYQAESFDLCDSPV